MLTLPVRYFRMAERPDPQIFGLRGLALACQGQFAGAMQAARRGLEAAETNGSRIIANHNRHLRPYRVAFPRAAARQSAGRG